MPTQLPAKTVCLNCDYDVKTENKHCPNCGQENADKRISLRLLLQDTIATAFNFESRVFKTIPLFLFYPGKLTNEFLEGKRVRYMHPFKIYLLSSLLFFFVVIRLFTPSIEKAIRDFDTSSEADDRNLAIGQGNSTLASDDEINTLKNLKDGFNNYESQDSSSDGSISDKLLDKIAQKQVVIKDSLSKVIEAIKRGELNDSTINIDSLENLVENSALLAETLRLADKKVKKGSGNLRRFYRLIQDRETTPEALVDSLDMQSETNNELYFAAQLLKVGRNDLPIFLANIINNIGTLMFFTLPLLALFFVPLYVRRKKYYIDHLIFMLHLQAFTFVILTLVALFLHWELYSISITFSVLLTVYAWFAFKKVYKQGFFKTTIKAYIISSLYIMTLTLMLAINLVYSFLMF